MFLSCSTKARTSASIVLRGANDFMCDEMERSLHDALCVVKRVLESKSVVPGGGAVEAALSIYLENYATSMVRIWFICIFMSKTELVLNNYYVHTSAVFPREFRETMGAHTSFL